MPKSSAPTRPIIDVRAPARAAATAWLKPLPPRNISNESPTSVSPISGRRAARTTRSIMKLPTTHTSGRTALPRRGLDSLTGELVHVDLPRVVVALAVGAHDAQVLGEDASPLVGRVRPWSCAASCRGGTSRCRARIGQATVRDSSGSQNSRSLCTSSGWRCSRTPMRWPPSMKCMQPFDSSTSCNGIQHVMPRVVEVAAPVGLVLVPARGDALLGRLGEELVVPELERLAHQRRRELDRPRRGTPTSFELGPEHRRARLEDPEVALGRGPCPSPTPSRRRSSPSSRGSCRSARSSSSRSAGSMASSTTIQPCSSKKATSSARGLRVRQAQDLSTI